MAVRRRLFVDWNAFLFAPPPAVVVAFDDIMTFSSGSFVPQRSILFSSSSSLSSGPFLRDLLLPSCSCSCSLSVLLSRGSRDRRPATTTTTTQSFFSERERENDDRAQLMPFSSLTIRLSILSRLLPFLCSKILKKWKTTTKTKTRTLKKRIFFLLF